MKLFDTRLTAFAAFVLSLASCRQDNMLVPDTSMILVTEKPAVELPVVNGVYGAMYSIKVNELENGVTTKSEIASAYFYDSPSNTAFASSNTSAGQVFVNNIDLNQGSNNGYDRQTSTGRPIENLNYDEGVKWVIMGDDGIPPYTFAWSKIFPVYKGDFPSLIKRNKGFCIDINSVTADHADSVFITLSAGKKIIVRHYPANAGKVYFMPEELEDMQVCPIGRPGYLQITASVDDIFDIVTGRPTLAVKQTADIRTVVIQ